jgi:hypothetical protein
MQRKEGRDVVGSDGFPSSYGNSSPALQPVIGTWNAGLQFSNFQEFQLVLLMVFRELQLMCKVPIVIRGSIIMFLVWQVAPS